MAQKIKLKPCPFCGKDPAVTDTGFGYSVVCRIPAGGCGASAGICITEDEAAECWNQRTNISTTLYSKLIDVLSGWTSINTVIVDAEAGRMDALDIAMLDTVAKNMQKIQRMLAEEAAE